MKQPILSLNIVFLLFITIGDGWKLAKITTVIPKKLSLITDRQIQWVVPAAILFDPTTVVATGSAKESLQLLYGYQQQVPDSINWIVLVVGLYMLQYKLYRWASYM